MKVTMLTALAAVAVTATGCATMSVPPSGSELIGHTLRVEIPNRPETLLAFQSDGSVTGTSEGNVGQGRWEVANGQLCMDWPRLGRECFPYTARFRVGQPVSLTGTSGVTTRATLQ